MTDSVALLVSPCCHPRHRRCRRRCNKTDWVIIIICNLMSCLSHVELFVLYPRSQVLRPQVLLALL